MNTIYAWGYGDILAQVLRGIALLFDPSAGLLITLAKIVILLGVIATLLGYFSDYGQRDPLRIFKFYVLVIGVWTVFLQVKTTVQVSDLQTNQVTDIRDVPIAIAKPLAFYSQVQKRLGEIVDTVFSHPQACQYSTNGFLGCISPVNAALGIRITDPYLLMSFNNFIQNCILTNVMDGSLNPQTLYTSGNLMTILGTNLHPVRFTKVYANETCNFSTSNSSTSGTCSPCREGYTCTCPDAWKNIKDRIEVYTAFTEGGVQGVAIKSIAAITGLTQNAVANALGSAPQYLYGISQSTNLLAQAIAINHVYDAIRVMAPGAEVSAGSVQRQMEEMGVVNAIVGSKYLPIVRGVLTVLVAALFPALFVFLLTPMAKFAISGYITILNFLTLWVFGEAVMHSLFLSKLHSMGQNMVQQGLEPLSMLGLPVIQANSMDYLAMIGNFYWLIPTMSFITATGFSVYGFKSLATSAGGQPSGLASASAGQSAMGSFSAGQVSFNNQSFGNTSFGNFGAGSFGFGGYSALTTAYQILSMNNSTVGQHSMGHIRQAGDMIQITGGTIGGNATYILANANKDAVPFHVAQHILGGDAKVSNLEMRGGVITSMKVVGKNGEVIEYDGAKLTFSKGNTTVAFSKASDGKWVFDSSVSTVMAGQITDGQLRNLSETISKAQQIQEGLSKATTWEQKVAFILQNKEFFQSLIQSAFGKVFSSNTTWTKDALRNYLSSEAFKEALEKSKGFREETGVSWQKVSKEGWEVNLGGHLGAALKAAIGKDSGNNGGSGNNRNNVSVSGGVGAGAGLNAGFSFKSAVFSAKEGKLYLLGSDGKVYSLTFTEEMKRGLTESYIKTLTTSSGTAGKWEKTGQRGTATSSDSSHSTTTAEQEVYNLTKAITEGLQEQYTYAKSQSAQVVASAITQWLNARKDAYVKQGMDENIATAQAIRDFHELKTRIDRGDMNALTELSNYFGNKLTLTPSPNLQDVKENVRGVERDIQKGMRDLFKLKVDSATLFFNVHASRNNKAQGMPDPKQAQNTALQKKVEEKVKGAFNLSAELNPRFTGARLAAQAQRYLLEEKRGNLNAFELIQDVQNKYTEDRSKATKKK